MHSRRFILTTGFAALSLGAGAARAGLMLVGAEGFDLLEPADLKRRQPVGATRALIALRSEGPGVQVAAPSSDRVVSPVTFDVTFTERNGAVPVMSSLKIEYNLGPFWKDVTRKVLGAAQIDGYHLRAAGARLPEGRHVLKMRIRDTAGRETATRIELTVV